MWYLIVFQVRVKAYDSMYVDQVSEETLTIQVTRNQYAPLFSATEHRESIPESHRLGSPVVQLEASDRDEVMVQKSHCMPPKGSCLESRLHDNTCLTDFVFPPGNVGANAACNYWSNLGSVHQAPIKAGWSETVWDMKFAWHFYIWPKVGIELQTIWSWVQRPIHRATFSQ